MAVSKSEYSMSLFPLQHCVVVALRLTCAARAGRCLTAIYSLHFISLGHWMRLEFSSRFYVLVLLLNFHVLAGVLTWFICRECIE